MEISVPFGIMMYASDVPGIGSERGMLIVSLAYGRWIEGGGRIGLMLEFIYLVMVF